MTIEEAAQQQMSAGDRLRDATNAVLGNPGDDAREARDDAYREWQIARSALAQAIEAEQIAIASIDAELGRPPRWKERWREECLRKGDHG